MSAQGQFDDMPGSDMPGTICNESLTAVIEAFAAQTKKSKIAISLDCWSRKRRKFMAMTGHLFSDPNGNIAQHYWAIQSSVKALQVPVN